MVSWIPYNKEARKTGSLAHECTRIGGGCIAFNRPRIDFIDSRSAPGLATLGQQHECSFQKIWL